MGRASTHTRTIILRHFLNFIILAFQASIALSVLTHIRVYINRHWSLRFPFFFFHLFFFHLGSIAKHCCAAALVFFMYLVSKYPPLSYWS